MLGFLADKTDVNRQDNVGWTPAHMAAQNGHVGALRILAAHGANLQQTMGAAPGATPASIAAANGRLSAIRFLEDHGADFSQADQGGAT